MVREIRIKDRRIQRTEALLRGALASLIREKAYDDIVVKEILKRANVGRSTFYTRFGDKDQLLRSCIHDILGSAESVDPERVREKPLEAILRFSLPILHHIERHRGGEQATVQLAGRRTVHEHLECAIAELIEDQVTTALRVGPSGTCDVSPDLLARWIASTFVVVLNWWMESDHPLSAREADRLFRALVEPSLAGGG